MRRALVAVLLVVPMGVAGAQGKQESDSTETNPVQTVALMGTAGFSLLRFALHQTADEGGQAQQFCYGTCSPRRRAAALQQTPGPTQYRANNENEVNPPGLNKVGESKNAVGKGEENRSSHHVDGSNDIFTLEDDASTFTRGHSALARGLPHGNGDVDNGDVDNGSDSELFGGLTDPNDCSLQQCASDFPIISLRLPVAGPSGGETFNEIFNSESLVASPDVITNPEPGTWALLGSGLLGLAYTRRRRNRGS